MKRWIPLSVIVLAGILAIVVAERQHISTRPSAQALLSATADAQHELTRIPTRFDRLSDDEEIAIGDRLAAQYASNWISQGGDAEANRRVEAYLKTVGERTASNARRKLPWKFHFIASPSFVNAFALPGGHVFVGQGLLALMHSEDALAAVLGHEVEHIDLRHCADRVQTEARLRNLGLAGALLSIPVGVFVAGYSKEQEMEADRDGTTLAVEALYSPLGILQLFAEFEELEHKANRNLDTRASSPVEEAAQLSLQSLAGYFQSHPPSAQRAQQIQALMRSQHWPTPPLRPLQWKPEIARR
jgi:predicted Zn-dependent protease